MTFDARETSRHDGQPVECYRFSRGGDVWLWTSADRPIFISVGSFQPAEISRGSVRDTDEDGRGSLEVFLPTHNEVAALFIGYLPSTPVSLILYRSHRGDAEITTFFSGDVASCRFDGPQAVLTCVPTDYRLKRRIPALVFQNQCNWPLYGEGCGVAKTAFRDAAIVDSVSGRDVVSSTFGARANGWYTNGWLEDSAGDVRFIVNHVGSTITLMAPFAGLTAGASVAAFAGCDRTEATCAAKFNNLVHHLGFARVPQRNPHARSLT